MCLDLLLKNGKKFMISLVMPKIDASKQIKFKTSMLQSNLCDFSDAYTVVKGTINICIFDFNTDFNNTFINTKLLLIHYLCF